MLFKDVLRQSVQLSQFVWDKTAYAVLELPLQICIADVLICRSVVSTVWLV